MQEKNLNAYNEKTQKGMIRHLVFRYSQTNGKILVIFVVNSKSVAPDLKIVAESLMRKYPQVSGVCANFNKSDSN
jgi:23S rRNA (uracil1939-C5)-methyltransferase